MKTKGSNRGVLLTIVAIYGLLLGILILIGALASSGVDASSYGSAVRMPVIAPVIAIILIISAVGLFARKKWSNLLFLLITPWAALALGSVFPESLWQEDAPYTVILVLAYFPAAILLSRGSALHALGEGEVGWVNRGGAVVAAAACIMLLARLMVATSKPSGGGGGGLGGMISSLDALNEHVQHLVLCDVPLIHYVGGLIAVSIPTRKRIIRSDD